MNRSPRFDIVEQPYGFREAALRDLGDGTVYARIREVVFPYYSFIPGDHGDPRLVVVVVPIDDEWSAHWYYYMNPFGPVPESYYRDVAILGTAPNDDNYSEDMGGVVNMWRQDRRAMKSGHWSGILGHFTYEDFIVEESMGPIADRSDEFLGTSDAVIVRARRMLLQALREHEAGKLPFGLDQDLDYSRIRALSIRFPTALNWRDIDPLNPPQTIPLTA